MDHLAGKRNLWYAISGALLVPCILSLIFFGLNFGIDFTGGSAWELQFDRAVDTESITRVMNDHGFSDAKVQQIGNADQHRYMIRTSEIREGSEQKKELEAAFSKLGTLNPAGESLSTVGASVGSSLRNRAVFAVAAASVGILLYIAYAFRNTQSPFLYGAAAIVAMLHDAIIVLGIFSILGWLFDVEVDALFITALLTIIGFSVHDTIVVFDRIRENLINKVATKFEDVVSYSIAQTIVRSLNTSLTVVITLLALYLFGGASTRNFVLALLIGVIAGTYSSIFNASQILVSWDNHEIQDVFNRVVRRKHSANPSTAS